MTLHVHEPDNGFALHTHGCKTNNIYYARCSKLLSKIITFQNRKDNKTNIKDQSTEKVK